MTFIRRLATDVAFYGSLDALQRAVSVLLVPIYTRFLTQQDFGNLDLIFAACSLVQVAVDMQQAQGFLRFYPEHLRNGTQRRFAGTNLLTRVLLGLLIALLFVGLGLMGFLEVSFLPPFSAWKPAWIVGAATVPAALGMELLLLQTRLAGSKRLFAIGTLGNVLLSTFLCAVLIGGFGLGLLGAVVGQACGKFFTAGVLLWGLRKEIALGWSFSIIREVFGHALPIVPGYWIGSFSVQASRFFVFGAMGPSEAAILALSLKIASVISLFSLSFRLAWQPLAMMNLGHERSTEEFAEAMRVFTAGALLGVCVLSALATPLVAALAPQSYAVAARYVGLFAIATVIAEIENTLQLGNQVAGKSYWLSLSATLGCAVNLTVLALLTGRLGIWAVVAGALGSSFSRVFVAYHSSQANHPLRYARGLFVRFGVGCIFAGGVGLLRGTVSTSVIAGSLAIIGIVHLWMSLNIYERRRSKAIACWVFSRTCPRL